MLPLYNRKDTSCEGTIMRDFRDRVAVVTGAGSGIGRALAENFSGLGSRVALVDIDADRLAEVSKDLEGRGGDVSTHTVDVGSEAAMKKLAKAVMKKYGRVDMVFNNAAFGVGGELVEVPMKDFKRLMDVNLWGVVYGVNAFASHMIERGEGHIVNISSINGVVPFAFNGPYNTSKFAVYGYTRTLRMELARHGVGVTVVCPGLIRTNIVKDSWGKKTGNTTLDRMAAEFERRMEEKGADPMLLAKAIQGAMEKNKGKLFFPFDSVFLRWFDTLFPNKVESINQAILAGNEEDMPIGHEGIFGFAKFMKRFMK